MTPPLPPVVGGLGRDHAARALGGAPRGETRMDWRPEGLVCKLELPGEAVQPVAAG